MRGIRARAAAGLRDAGRADADGSEPEPANRAKIAPGRAESVQGGVSPRPNPLDAFYPPKTPHCLGTHDIEYIE